MKGIPATVTVVADAIGGTMLLTLLVPVPLLTGLDCLPLRARAALGRLNLLAFAIVAALEAWLGAEVIALSLSPREKVRVRGNDGPTASALVG